MLYADTHLGIQQLVRGYRPKLVRFIPYFAIQGNLQLIIEYGPLASV